MNKLGDELLKPGDYVWRPCLSLIDKVKAIDLHGTVSMNSGNAPSNQVIKLPAELIEAIETGHLIINR